MTAQKELENLKKILTENLEKADFVGFRRNIETFQKQFKEILSPEEQIELQNLIKRFSRPQATFHEFILFLIVASFLIFIFGEKIEKNANNVINQKQNSSNLKAKY